MNAQFSLIDELQEAIQGSSDAKRLDTLRQVTDLFLNANKKLSEKQIEVFDNVLMHLADNIDSNGLAELSNRLGGAHNAPIGTIRRLANNDSISIAGPVISRSTRLTSADLIDIIHRKSAEHRYAISGRAELDEMLTSALIEHGETQVLHRLLNNTRAQFSEKGFATLLRKSEGKDNILEALGLRTDLPHGILRDILTRANTTLREKLIAAAPPELRTSIERILLQLSAVVENETQRQALARRTIEETNRNGCLNGAMVQHHAKLLQHNEVTVALEIMTGSKFDFIQRALASEMRESALIICKAAGLEWPAANAVLDLNPLKLSPSSLTVLERSYSKLTAAAAQRTLRFWQIKSALAG